jgi:hypothetical protein
MEIRTTVTDTLLYDCYAQLLLIENMVSKLKNTLFDEELERDYFSDLGVEELIHIP